MRMVSITLLAGSVFLSAVAGAQVQVPKIPGAPGEAGGQDAGSAAKNALNNVKSARSNISKKDYPSAQTDIGNARKNLSALTSSAGMGQVEGMPGGKSAASPLSKVDQQLGDAEKALANGQPKAADNMLKKTEAPLSSIG